MRPLAFVLILAMCPSKGVNVSQPPAKPAPTSESPLTITGMLTSEGVECQAMRQDGTNKFYTLAGKLGGLKSGDHVKVVGTIAEVSYCMQGTTISVSSIARV